MASRVILNRSLRQRDPREHKPNHLRWIASLPSVISGERPCQACHIRMPDLSAGKRQTGKGEKSHDCFTLPMTLIEHAYQHRGSESEFWKACGIDPCKTALALWRVSGDDKAGEEILRNARRTDV